MCRINFWYLLMFLCLSSRINYLYFFMVNTFYVIIVFCWFYLKQIFSINYLHVLNDIYEALIFLRNFIVFIAVTFIIQIKATCFPILDRT